MPPRIQPRRQPRRNARLSSTEELQNGSQIEKQSEAVSNPQNIPLVTNDAQREEVLPSEPVSQDRSTSSVSASTQAAPRPTQRLDSLYKRNTLASSSSSSQLGVPSSRPTELKFQPKSVTRRSKEEREAQDRAEEERRLARLVDSSRNGSGTGDQYGRAAGRGGPSRAGYRGGISGWRTDRRGIGQASGPLSGGPTQGEPTDKRGRSSRGRVSIMGTSSFESSPATGSRVKKESGLKAETGRELEMTKSKSSFGRADATNIKDEDQDTANMSLAEDSDNDKGSRINIEHINLISEEETDNDDLPPEHRGHETKSKPPGWATRPIRLDRQEHVERSIGVNTEASSLTSAELRRRAKERDEAEGSLFLPEDDEEDLVKQNSRKTKKKSKDVEFVRDKRRWKGVYPEEDDKDDTANVKEEPRDDDDDVIIIDAANALEAQNPENCNMEAPLESSAKRTLKEPRGDREFSLPQVKRRRKPGLHKIKPVLQTEEDRQEWERYETDGVALAEELGTTGFHLDPVSAKKDSDGNALTEDAAEEQKDRRSDLVYLFQLPPVVPNLVDVNSPKELEPTNKSVTQIFPAVVDEGPLKGSASTATATSSKKTDSSVKIEEEDSPMSLESKIPNAMMAEDVDDFTGDLGMLTIYESGEATLSWGGIDHELGRGVEGELLQEAILLNYKTSDKEETMGRADPSFDNAAVALGQVSGGFVLTPDWLSMFR